MGSASGKPIKAYAAVGSNGKQCVPIKSFGKKYIHDIVKEINSAESIAQWCALDTRTGALTCTLDKDQFCDAEVYADELKEARSIDFREDQRSE